MPTVSPSDLVLEVGAGSAPWARADVLVDRYLKDPACHRGGAEIIQDVRPLVIAAGEHLPFKDKVFDYVYCNHVIEHAEDIEGMLREMARVGRAGFIECPNPLLEQLHPLPEHRWYVALVDGQLLIAPKKDEPPSLQRYYFSICYSLLGAHRIVSPYWQMLVTRLEWKERIPYRVLADVRELLAWKVDGVVAADAIGRRAGRTLLRAALQLGRERIKRQLISALDATGLLRPARHLRRRLVVHPKKCRHTLSELLCCPFCHGDLIVEHNAYSCTICSNCFPVIDGVPVFVQDPQSPGDRPSHPAYL